MNDAGKPRTPRQRYETELASAGYLADAAQLRAVQVLDALHHALLAQPATPWWRRLLGRESPPVKGLYLWGEVGRGKTWLMDLFFECLPQPDKLRLHFHRFMHTVHAELRQLVEKQDPLAIVAQQFRARARIICLDELYVSDITDAMLLGRLFQHLFAEGVTLIATSNVAPDELYRNGLQRQRFLPAIRLIKQHLRVLHMDGGTDYRLRHLEKTRLYCTPAGAAADRQLAAFFEKLSRHAATRTEPLAINGRAIAVVRHAEGIAWFRFADLCEGPRSQEDYIEIARACHTVLVSDIPPLTAEREDAARRFVALVDEFYDRRVKLAVSAAVPIERLYGGSRLTLEFRRTASRLQEMQSRQYLCAPHLP